MACGSVVEKIVQGLEFEVEAVPQEDSTEIGNDSNTTPLNVRIRVKKMDEYNAQMGKMSVPKLSDSEAVPKIRLHNSDRTIMSFDVAMEPEHAKKPKRKPRKSFFGCLGLQYDDDESTYLPSTLYNAKTAEGNVASKSDGVMRQHFTLSKTNYDSHGMESNQRKPDILGKCKPGGCLDPPFGEERYSYMPMQKGPTKEPAKIKLKKRVEVSNAPLDSLKDNDTIMLANSKLEAEDGLILSLYEAKPKMSSDSKYSDSVITYPPDVTSSITSNEKNLKPSEARRRKSFNENIDAFFSTPRKTSKFSERSSNDFVFSKNGTTKTEDIKHTKKPVINGNDVVKTKQSERISSSQGQPYNKTTPKKERQFDFKSKNVIKTETGVVPQTYTHAHVETVTNDSDPVVLGSATKGSLNVKEPESEDNGLESNNINDLHINKTEMSMLRSNLPNSSQDEIYDINQNPTADDTKIAHKYSLNSLDKALRKNMLPSNNQLTQNILKPETTLLKTKTETSTTSDMNSVARDNNLQEQTSLTVSIDKKMLRSGVIENETASLNSNTPIEMNNNLQEQSSLQTNKLADAVRIETVSVKSSSIKSDNNSLTNKNNINNFGKENIPSYVETAVPNVNSVNLEKTSIPTRLTEEKMLKSERMSNHKIGERLKDNVLDKDTMSISSNSPDKIILKSAQLQEVSSNNDDIIKDLEIPDGLDLQNATKNHDGLSSSLIDKKVEEDFDKETVGGDNVKAKIFNNDLKNMNDETENYQNDYLTSIKEDSEEAEKSSITTFDFKKVPLHLKSQGSEDETKSSKYHPEQSNQSKKTLKLTSASASLQSLTQGRYISLATSDKSPKLRYQKSLDGSNQFNNNELRTLRESKSTSKKDHLAVDLANQSNDNNRNDLTTKTADTSEEMIPHTDDVFTITQSDSNPDVKEIKLSVDLYNEILIQLRKNSNQQDQMTERNRLTEGEKDANLPNISGIGSHTREFIDKIAGGEIQNLLNTIYENELVPLQMTIENLKHEIDVIVHQQSVMLDEFCSVIKAKPVRLLQINPRCKCWRK